MPQGVSMRLTLLALSVAVLVGGCASTPPEADPVQLKLNDLDARIEIVQLQLHRVRLRRGAGTAANEHRHRQGKQGQAHGYSLRHSLTWAAEIGRASCRERMEVCVVAGAV